MAIVYIYDDLLLSESDRNPAVENRASMVHEMISAYGLLDKMKSVKSCPASDDQMQSFHSSHYLSVLQAEEENEEIDEEFGLNYDCPKIEKLEKYCRVIAGGTITAAKEIARGSTQIAINWFGGWHHAQRDSASGFCYVNDIVIGIQELTKDFDRILYLDLDVHHGDGVENAFSCSKRVLTVSFHLHEPGFFPGTGNKTDNGFGPGRNYSINFPFERHFSGSNYVKYFQKVFHKVLEKFNPQVIVTQCGADILPGDPLGGANVTPEDMGICIKRIMATKLPLIFLGGGGYNFPNAARYWTYLTSVICDVDLEEDIPDHEFFLEYGPGYELSVDRKRIHDPNKETELQKTLELIENQLNLLQ